MTRRNKDIDDRSVTEDLPMSESSVKELNGHVESTLTEETKK